MPRPIALTERKLEIILSASHGMTAKEIGQELGTSERVVNQELFIARQILGAANTTELVAMALRQKWIR